MKPCVTHLMINSVKIRNKLTLSTIANPESTETHNVLTLT